MMYPTAARWNGRSAGGQPAQPTIAARSAVAGLLEGFSPAGGHRGWACAGTPRPKPEPLQVQLTLEDLLNPRSRWLLAQVISQRPRPDLLASGVDTSCGFLFLGHSGVELPPPSNGLVVRAFFDAERRIELPGSPLRLDGERYAGCRSSADWASAAAPVWWGSRAISCVAGPAVPPPCNCGSMATAPPWRSPRPIPCPPVSGPSSCPCPPLCDGAVHHLQLETASRRALDQRFELVPFQLTPWAALLRARPPPLSRPALPSGPRAPPQPAHLAGPGPTPRHPPARPTCPCCSAC